MIKLFREPQPGELVVIGADPSEGGDYCAAQVLSKKQADQLLTFHAKIDSAQFGHELNKIGKYIHMKTGEYPIIAVERNVGMATINVLQTHNYPKLFRMKNIGDVDQHEITDKIGWNTNTATRPKMLDDLSLALKQQAIGVYDLETIKELMSFVRSERTGKAEAAVGSFDDLVMALAIAWQVYGTATSFTKEGMAARVAMFPKQELFDDTGVPNY